MSDIKKKFGQTTISGKGGGGNAVTVVADSNLFMIVGGNALTYLGANGIKHVTSVITTCPSTISQTFDLPDGLGVIRSLDTNTLRFCVNDNGSYISYDIAAQPVYAISDGTLSGGSISGANWSYPKYRIAGVI